MGKSLRFYLISLSLFAISFIQPMSADAADSDQYLLDKYEHAHETIHKVIHQKDLSANIDIPLYIAKIIAIDVMNECDLIESVHDPRLAPDQSMVFIGYFQKDEPNKLRILSIYRETPESKILITNNTIENFSKFTQEHYRTRFYYVEPGKNENIK